MEANEPSYSVYAPSNFPSLAPVSASSRSNSRPPLRGAAPQRGSGIFFLFMIGLIVAGAGVAGMTYLSPRLEAKHSANVPNAVAVNVPATPGTTTTIGTTTGITSPTSITTTTSASATATSTSTATAKIEFPANPPSPGATVASANPDKNKPKRRVKRVPPSTNGNAAPALPDGRMPTAKLPDNPYPDKE
jgi:hypothetical protein